MPELSLDYVNARILLTRRDDTLKVALVGCGGTGSWLAPAIARIARLLGERGIRMDLAFVDPDAVEAKNIYRQNFCDAEIGHNKAEALAARYGKAWGVEIAALPWTFQKESELARGKEIDLVIGCVDNTTARRSIQEVVSHSWRQPAWWLDCGNGQSSGQVLLGAGKPPEEDPFLLPGSCAWLPSPTLQHPDLLKSRDRAAAGTEAVSCAEMALQDAQGLSINARVAAEAADYLVRLLVTRDLRKYATYLDLASGTTRSEYITEEKVRKFLPKRKDQGG
jgi:PRTRC genetic system ThiF family protein